MWKWNIQELSRFKDSFNNKKIVFIATDKGFDGPEEVKEQFQGYLPCLSASASATTLQ